MGVSVEAVARQLYAQRVAERGPAWDQLGEVTKQVWREIALQEIFG